MKKELKQPAKFTHQFLKKKEQNEDDYNEDGHEEGVVKDANKTKQIQKEKYVRKVINKPNQPSALRLEQINKTFNNLSEKSDKFIKLLNINQQLLDSLTKLSQKFVCDCKRNVKYYCLKCNKKCGLLDIPLIKLPLSIHIIHHSSQKINKSSVAPMRFLTNDIAFYPYQGKQSESKDKNKEEVFDKLPKPGPNTFILYPHKKSKNLKDVSQKIEDLIVLDCTWFQTDQIIENIQESGYKNFIKLQGYESVFWRYNHFGEEALSSAESILYFFRQYQIKQHDEQKRYDNLMLLYALNMKIVQRSME